MIDNEKLLRAILLSQRVVEKVRELTEPAVRVRVGDRLRLEPGELDRFVEEIYAKMPRALGTFDRRRSTNAFAWFMTIVDHAIVDYARKHGSVDVSSITESEESIDDGRLPPDAEFERRRVFDVLALALARMPPEKREILLAVAAFPFDHYDKIMKIKGIKTVTAAREAKLRAATELRRIVAELGYDEAAVMRLLAEWKSRT